MRPPFPSELRCPHCGAMPHEPCYRPDGGIANDYHLGRREAAAAEERRMREALEAKR